MARAVAIVSGIIVAVLTGVPLWLFLMAATWSGIHGATSELMLLVLTTIATVIPPVCGFLAGRAIEST